MRWSSKDFYQYASHLCADLERKPLEECQEKIRTLKYYARQRGIRFASQWIQKGGSTRSMLASYGILLVFKTMKDDGTNLEPIGKDWHPKPHVWLCQDTQERRKKRHVAKQSAKLDTLANNRHPDGVNDTTGLETNRK